MGDTYPLVQNNITEMTGKTPNASPRSPDSGNNRHCTAHEEFMETISLICADLEKIDAIIGYGNNCGGIMNAASRAIMLRNMGI